MTDEQILKKLYTLQGLKSPDTEAFISDWINDTKIDIAQSSEANVGFGNGFKIVRKVIKDNSKTHPDLASMLKAGKNKYILSNGSYAILFKNDLGIGSKESERAKTLAKRIEEEEDNCTEIVKLPSRAQLDAIIKDWKAQDRSTRTKYPLYDLGDGLPMYNAQYLSDMLSIMPTTDGSYNPKKKTLSPLYIQFFPAKGVLMPVSK